MCLQTPRGRRDDETSPPVDRCFGKERSRVEVVGVGGPKIEWSLRFYTSTFKGVTNGSPYTTKGPPLDTP